MSAPLILPDTIHLSICADRHSVPGTIHACHPPQAVSLWQDPHTLFLLGVKSIPVSGMDNYSLAYYMKIKMSLSSQTSGPTELLGD